MSQSKHTIFTGGHDALSLNKNIDEQINETYYFDAETLVRAEGDVEKKDVRKFKVMITVEELTA
jgi:hypothetical protein